MPVYFGSAITGVGVRELLAGVEEWLPPAAEASDAPSTGTVFKIARRPPARRSSTRASSRAAWRCGSAWRCAVATPSARSSRSRSGSPASIASPPARPRTADAASAGEIVGLHGLRAARIGDRIGAEARPSRASSPRAFPAPALESIVQPLDPGQITRLRAALEQLAEQDPLISLRQRNDEGEISRPALRRGAEGSHDGDAGAGLRRRRRRSGRRQTICIERPIGTRRSTPRSCSKARTRSSRRSVSAIEPAERGSGIRYRARAGLAAARLLPRHRGDGATRRSRKGLHGWEVTDCVVTLTHAGFSSPVSTAGDFRKLTPLVLMQALQQAGTEVCEPIEELELEIPEDTFGAVCGTADQRAGDDPRRRLLEGATHRIVCEIPTAELRGVEQQLPGLTRGEELGLELRRLRPGHRRSAARRRVGRTRSIARTTSPRWRGDDQGAGAVSADGGYRLTTASVPKWNSVYTE